MRLKEHTESFATSEEAWDFVRACDSAGDMAGHPSLTSPYTVRVISGSAINERIHELLHGNREGAKPAHVRAELWVLDQLAHLARVDAAQQPGGRVMLALQAAEAELVVAAMTEARAVSTLIRAAIDGVIREIGSGQTVSSETADRARSEGMKAASDTLEKAIERASRRRN